MHCSILPQYQTSQALTGDPHSSLVQNRGAGRLVRLFMILLCSFIWIQDGLAQCVLGITKQPVGATKCVGDTYSFSVVNTGSATYQWQKDGVDLVDNPGDIGGSTTTQLTLTNLCATCDPGRYVVKITGTGTCLAQSVSSSAAVLVVNTPVTITTHPNATTTCEGGNATFTVQASGTITGYKWYRNGTAINGATIANYQLTTSLTNNGDKYKVDVLGSCGTVTSGEVTLTVNAKPVITAQPSGATKCVGDNYTFTVTATDAGSYQWQKDGVDLAGATSANLVLTALAVSSAGTYRVRVIEATTCNNESFFSSAATLVVNTPVIISTQPTATAVCEGGSATFTVQAAGTITGYQWYRNGVTINGATSAILQLTTSLTNNNEQYKVDVQGPCGNVTSSEVALRGCLKFHAKWESGSFEQGGLCRAN